VEAPADPAGDPRFGDDEEHEVHPAGALPPQVVERLLELAELAGERDPGSCSALLARDWEGCLFALCDGFPQFDVLALSDSGMVGHGGVNLPRMHKNVFALIGPWEPARRGVPA
jgi:hypothetical protein